MSWINEKVVGLTQAELLDWNETVNKELAKRLHDEPDAPVLHPIADALPEYLLSLGYGDRKYEGLRTGLDEFDHLIGGINKFCLVAARAGTGKSTLAVQLALGVQATENIPILYYSFEMPASDIYTMLLQNLRRGSDYQLTRSEITLHGNNPGSSEDTKAALHEASTALQEIAGSFYVIDASLGAPTTERMTADIEQLKARHGTEHILVIIDSVQDLVQVGSAGATTAEAETAQKIVEIQQATDATFLAISQKSKSGGIDDPYAAVLGSVSLIHKPTSVIELIGVYDLIRAVKDADTARVYRKLADQSDIPRPVIARVIKGRHNGNGHVSLKHFGRYSYFEAGRIPDYDTEMSLYDLNSFTN